MVWGLRPGVSSRLLGFRVLSRVSARLKTQVAGSCDLASKVLPSK